MLLVLLAIAGCGATYATPPPVSSRTKADLALMAPKVKNGMTPEEVIVALGQPDSRRKSEKDPTRESMLYTAGDMGQHVIMIMLRDGKVFKHLHFQGPDKMLQP